MRKLLIVLLCLATLSARAATTYYVDNGGNNANAGTSASPWQTLTYALAHIAAGDTITLKAGTYTESPTTTIAGTAGNVITITGVGPTTIFGGNGNGIILTVNKPYYRITNLKVYGAGSNGGAGVTTSSGTGCPSTGTGSTYQDHGVGAKISLVNATGSSSGASNIQIDNCDLSGGDSPIDMDQGNAPYDGTTGPQNITVGPNNTFHDWYSNGSIVIQGRNILIYDNQWVGNGHGWDTYRGWGKNITIRHNTYTDMEAGNCAYVGGNHADIWQTFGSSTHAMSQTWLFEQNTFTNCTCQFGNLEARTNIKDWTNPATNTAEFTIVDENKLPTNGPGTPNTTNDMGYLVVRNNVWNNCRFQLNNWLHNSKFYNNTLYNSPNWATGWAFDAGRGEAIKGDVYNNLFIQVGPSSSSVGAYGVQSGSIAPMQFHSDYNMITAVPGGTAKTDPNGTGQADTGTNHTILNTFTAAQIFVNPGIDFHLKTGSPAIGAGKDLSAVAEGAFSNDHDGTTRTGTFDMGAYAATGTPPATVPAFTSGASTVFTQNSLGAFVVTVNSSPTSAITKSGSLPAGVTFTDNSNNTAALSGTPTASGNFPLTWSATNSAGTTTQNFTLTVSAAISAPTPPAQIVLTPR